MLQPYETYRLRPVAGSHGTKLQLRIRGGANDRTCTFETQPQALLPELVAGVGGEAAHAQLVAFIRSKCDGRHCLALYRVRAESRPAIVELLGTVLVPRRAAAVATLRSLGCAADPDPTPGVLVDASDFGAQKEWVGLGAVAFRVRSRMPAACLPLDTNHATLGLRRSASREEIRAAYLRKAKQTHPDKGGDPRDFIKIKRAYDCLVQ